MNLARNSCLNLGGIQRLWLANQPKAASSILQIQKGVERIILDREVFSEVGLDTGSYQESHTEDDGGSVFQSRISFQLRKDRQAFYQFEQVWNRKRILAVVKNNNGDFLIFRNLRLTRQKSSGETTSDFNGFQFQLIGNDWQASTYGQAIEAIFWFDTQFQAGADRFNPSLALSGTAKWSFANGACLYGNAIDSDGMAEGLNGSNQQVIVNAETSAEGITATYFRACAISGELRLDLLPNLQLADLALNQIESVSVGEWVNKSGVVIELRNNQLTAEAQHQLVDEIANRFVGASSDLKLGLFNQAEPPNQETVRLAVDLYNEYGIEIRLPAVQANLTIGHG